MVGDGVKLPQNNMNIDYSPTTITAVAAATTGLTPIHTTGAFATPWISGPLHLSSMLVETILVGQVVLSCWK